MSWFSDKKLLVPIDFGESSEHAIESALKLASRPEQIHLIHVDPDLVVTSPAGIWDTLSEDERRKNVETYFRNTFNSDRYRNLNFHVAFGDPGQQIANYANNLDVGAIVIPSHGRTGLKRLLIGSVAERVVRMAHCPVLVLRQ